MTIYDKLRMRIRTWTEGLNVLFDMGSELEGEVDSFKGGIIKNVTLTEVDKHYTLTILYDDDTSDVVTWDDSTVGIEDITMTYQNGVYILTIILTDGTRYTFSIPVGNVVTEEELQDAVDTINAAITAMNVGSPDDTASSTGSLWARIKNAVMLTGTQEINGEKTFSSNMYRKLPLIDIGDTSDSVTTMIGNKDKNDVIFSRLMIRTIAGTQATKLAFMRKNSSGTQNETTNIVTEDDNNSFTGVNTVPTPTSSSPANVIVNKEYVDSRRVEENLINSTRLKSFLENAKAGDSIIGLRLVYDYTDEQQVTTHIVINEFNLVVYNSYDNYKQFVGSGAITTSANVNNDNNILLRFDYNTTTEILSPTYLDIATKGLKYDNTFQVVPERISLTGTDIIYYN